MGGGEAVVTGDGELIRFERLAGEAPVLLVHGFASDARSSWGASGWFRTLSDASRGAVTVDLRGHGSSSKPACADAYSPAILASDLCRVLDEAQIERADVLGYSMGGQVARQLAADHPDRVGRLVLGGIGQVEQFGRWGPYNVRAALLEGRAVEDPELAGLVAAVQGLPEESRLALAACAEGMARHPVDGAVGVPALVAAGDRDGVAADAVSLARELGAEFLTIPGRHHGSTLSARAFKAGVMDFLRPAV